MANVQLRKLTDPAVPQKATTSPGLLFYTVDPTIPSDDPAGTSFRIPYSVMFAGYAALASAPTFTGTVTAPSFAGDGSSLTGLANAGITLTGDTLWVDAVNGNDGTAARGNSAKPFLTLTAAQTAAQSGDVVHVRPGAYAPSAQLGKNGVNWYFDPGAVVNLTVTETTFSGMWLGTGFLLTYRVRGYGVFNYTASAHVTGPPAAIIALNAGTSDVVIEGTDFTVTDTAGVDPVAKGPRVFEVDLGTLTVRARNVTCTGAVGTGGSDTTGAGFWWTGGELHGTAQRVKSTGWGIYSQVGGSSSVEGHVAADQWQTALAPCYNAGTNGNATVWFDGNTVQNTAFGNSVFNNGSEKVYAVGKKLFGQISSTNNGLLYVTAQKVSPVLANLPLLNFTGTGQSWVTVMDWDTAGLTTNVWSFSNGTVDVFGGAVRPDAAALGVLHSGGAVRIHDARIDTSSNTATNPVTVSGSGLELDNCTLIAGSGRGSLTAAAPQTVTTDGGPFFNNAPDANVTLSPRTQGPITSAGPISVTASGKTLKTSGTTTLTTNDTELLFQCTGDSLGTMELHLQNRSGQAGPLIKSLSLNVIDLGFQGSSVGPITTRFEGRGAGFVYGDAVQFQFGTAGSPSLVAGTTQAGFARANSGASVVAGWWNNTDTVVGEQQAALTTTWTTATDASRKARMVMTVYDTAAREIMRGEASGTAPMIGFLGAAAVVQQANASQAAITAVTDANAKAALQALYNLLKNYGLAPATA